MRNHHDKSCPAGKAAESPRVVSETSAIRLIVEPEFGAAASKDFGDR